MNSSVAAGLALVEDDHGGAPAASAFSAFTSKSHAPRWISAIWPATKPVKSLTSQPAVELGLRGRREHVVGDLLEPGGHVAAAGVA